MAGLPQAGHHGSLVVSPAETELPAGPGKQGYHDARDGHQAERNALLEEFASVRNPVVLGGDRHMTTISDLRKDFADPGSAVVGAEFVGTSISGNGDRDQAAFHARWDPMRAGNPHVRLIVGVRTLPGKALTAARDSSAPQGPLSVPQGTSLTVP
ncbi:alkaline phosphatase D family protein [Streptomyces maremycinicus]|uniref:alkaline phosphatase D family protein n=1 Tax=Streptomyces maremycinicus TaxID=1679753 RepID=UPI000A574498